MENFGVAVKSFIVEDSKVLLIKRRSNDAHKPDEWDIPGGRLDIGEDPHIGLKRETKEETGLDIDIIMPLDVQHFVRDDGQKITMIIFLCRPLTDRIKLSEEHQEYKWEEIRPDKAGFPEWIHRTVDAFLRCGLDKPV